MALTLKTVVSQIEQYGASNCGDLAALLGVSNETMLTFLTASVNRGELIFINGLYAESGKRALRKPTKLQRNPDPEQLKAVAVQQRVCGHRGKRAYGKDSRPHDGANCSNAGIPES